MTARSSILITGAAGFMGTKLGRALLAKGHSVVGFDARASSGSPFPIVIGDIRDVEAIDALCDKYGVERIIHGGGISGRSVARSDRRSTIDVNVGGTVAVMEAAVRRAVRKVVLCSSGSVYGTTKEDPVTEETPLEPVNSYGASKVAAEAVLRAYRVECGIDGVALRIFQAYGPWRQTACNIRALVHAAAAGQPTALPYHRDARFHYVYIDDVVRALIAALFSDPLPRLAYHVGGGSSLTLGEVVDVAGSVLPNLDVRFGESSLSSEYGLGYVDQSAIKRDLGFEPRFDLASGIRHYADQLREG